MTYFRIHISAAVNLVAELTEMEVVVSLEQSDDTVDVCDVVEMVSILQKIQMFRIDWIDRIMKTLTQLHTTHYENMNINFEVICSFLHLGPSNR